MGQGIRRERVGQGIERKEEEPMDEMAFEGKEGHLAMGEPRRGHSSSAIFIRDCQIELLLI